MKKAGLQFNFLYEVNKKKGCPKNVDTSPAIIFNYIKLHPHIKTTEFEYIQVARGSRFSVLKVLLFLTCCNW